jgi:hypothetical protein
VEVIGVVLGLHRRREGLALLDEFDRDHDDLLSVNSSGVIPPSADAEALGPF